MAIGATDLKGTAGPLRSPRAGVEIRSAQDQETAAPGQIFGSFSQSLWDSGSSLQPKAGTTLAMIPGFNTQKTWEVFRFDYYAVYSGAAGLPFNIGLAIDSVVRLPLAIPSSIGVPVNGTFFMAANGQDVQLVVIADETNAAALYLAQIVATRQYEGNKAG